MSLPRCPYCNAQGLDTLKVELTASFQVVYCSQCGAIHGVIPLAAALTEAEHVETKISLPRPLETALAEAAKPAPEQEQPKIKPRGITKEKVGAMVAGGGYFALALLSPLCPKCNLEMVKFTVPEGHKEAGQEFWRCPNFQSCRQWQREG